MVKSEGESYLFCGQEHYLKEEATSKIISKLLPPQSKSLNCDIYNARDDDRDIFHSLDTLPFLSEKRIVVIKDIEYLKASKKRALLAYLEYPHKHICLVLQSNQTPSSDKFINSLSRHAKTIQFKRLDKRGLKEWIYKRLLQQRKSITKEALEFLLELRESEELTRLSGELEKLVTYKGEERTITQKDVMELVAKGVTKKVFDLMDAVSFKDRDSALSVMRQLSYDRKDMPEVMGLMGWQMRRVWKAKTLLAGGEDRYRVASQLKIRDFSVDKFLSQVELFSLKELKRNFKLLCEADHSIKRGQGKPEFILEKLIMKLCSA